MSRWTPCSRPVLACCALLAAGLAQAGVVTVVFEHPERFTDADHGTRADRHRSTLREHLQVLGLARLPDDQRLAITVTNVDLAGEVPPFSRNMTDLRVLKGQADWPRITLSYTLADTSGTLRSGSADLADLAYLQAPVHGRLASDHLPYERRLLTRWFDSTFGVGH